MNWYKLGSDTVIYLFPTLLSLVIVILAWRRYVAPELYAALEDAQKVITTLASLGGIKKADRVNLQQLSKAVTTDLVKNKYPEFDLIKMAVSPSTWEQIEDALENNPTGVMELIDKYGHYFGMKQDTGQSPLKTDF